MSESFDNRHGEGGDPFVRDLLNNGHPRQCSRPVIVRHQWPLTLGKQTDLVVLTPDERAMSHLLNPMAHAVFQGTPVRVEVETVIVNGRVVKYAGKLLDHDCERITNLANASREYLISQIGEDKIRETMNGIAFVLSAPSPAAL